MKRTTIVLTAAALTITALLTADAFARGGGWGRGGGGGWGRGDSFGRGDDWGGDYGGGSVRYSQPENYGWSQPAAADYARTSSAAARPATSSFGAYAPAKRPAPWGSQSGDAAAANREQFVQGMGGQSAATATPARRVCAGNYPNYGAATTLPTNAVTCTSKGNNYWYAGGTYYCSSGGGYVICRPPVACVVPALPIGSYPFACAERNYWYYGGAYYSASGDSYEVVAPPTGAVIADLPPDAKQVTIGGQTYYDCDGTMYEAVMMNGETCYRVVDVGGN